MAAEPLQWNEAVEVLRRFAEAGERANAALREVRETVERLRDEDDD
jgi:hypothetical protein